MTGVELTKVAVAGVGVPLTLSVPVGRVRAIVSPDRRVARAVADAITGFPPGPGVSITGESTDGRPVHLVPADGALLPHLTVLDNIIRTDRPSDRRRRAEAEREVRARATEYGLDRALGCHPHEIAVDRRRMAGLARAMRGRPVAIVLEDDLGLPTWGALLAKQWPPPSDPPTPSLLLGVATVLIVPTKDRAAGLDADPVVVGAPDRGRRDAA